MSSLPLWSVTSFYRFVPLEETRLERIQAEMKAWMTEHGVLGLVILATEGVNGTVAGTAEAIVAYKERLLELIGTNDVRFKDSESETPPFYRTSVVRRQEIVGLKRTDLVPEATEDHHLSPREWHDFLASDRPRVVVDTRNRYETRLGRFAGAIDPAIDRFSQWKEYADRADLPRDIPILIYCTGGIRCEKVLLDLRERGFDQVYQLRDGILGYLAEYPEGFYEGECYVFDDRVALDAAMKPTRTFGICPCCGLTGDAVRSCDWCGRTYYGCPEGRPDWGRACSKACRDLVGRHGPRLESSLSG